MNLKIRDIIECTNGSLVTGNLDYECVNFSRDTRIIKPGDTFVAIKGDTFDGNIFWKEAFDNGADTVIIDNIDLLESDIEKYSDKNIIQVYDTRKALKEIAKAKRNLYKDLIVIGVTGSVGKTSTKDIVANVISQKYNTLKTEGNNNNEIGLPFTILNLRDQEVAVIEMGMNHLGEISELSKIAKPTISIITNIGTSHIGNLGSRENILKAKLEILDGMDTKKVIINNDNDMLHDWKSRTNKDVEIHTFGVENMSECMARNIVRNDNSTKYICSINGEEIPLNVPVGSFSFVFNSLCACMVGKMLNLTNEQIQKGISEFKLTKKRMEIIELDDNIKIINDAYNASLDSMKAAIDYLNECESKRKIAVLGDMFELGNFAEELHRKVGEEVAKSKIDLLYLIGENSKYIKEEAEKFGFSSRRIFEFNTRDEILEKIQKDKKNGDIILLKASNGMKLFEIAENLRA